MYCPSCGEKNDANDIACQRCGALLPGIVGGGRTMPPDRAAPPPQHHPASVGGATMHQRPEDIGLRHGGLGHSDAAPGTNGSLIGRIKLVVEQGKILGEQFLLNDSSVIIGRYDAATGRCPDIDLTAQDPAYVHRQHVRIDFDARGRGLTVEDLGGRNGSYVNNNLVEKHAPVAIKIGDKVRVGRVVMRLQLAPEVADDGQKR